MPIDPSTYLPESPPTVPDRTSRTTFPTQMYNFFVWMAKATSGGLYYALANLPGNLYSNALEVYNAAITKALSNFKGIYAGGTTYALNDTVYVAASGFYISNVGSNLGNAPASSPTQWSPISLGNRSGGATVAPATQTVLVAGSAQVQKFAPTTPGQSVKMPDATTCQLVTTPYFMLINNGTCDLKLVDSAGTTRGFAAAGACVAASLYDNSTAAGGWGMKDANLFGVTASLEATSGVTLTTALTLQVIQLDSTKTVVVFGSTGATNVYAACFDSSTNTWGAITAMAAVANTGSFMAQAISATTFVVFLGLTSGAVRVQCVAGSVSTVTITAGSAVTLAISNTPTFFSTALVTATACVSFSDGTATKIVGVTVSGTTVTFGSTVSASAAAGGPTLPCHLYVSGTTLVAITATSTPSIICLPYAVSGTTLTVGTSATSTAMTAATTMRTIAISSTGWYSIAVDTTGVRLTGQYWTLSGTVITADADAPNASIAFVPSTQCDMQLVNGKLLLVMADGTNFSTNLMTFSGTTSTPGAATSTTGLPTGWAAGVPIVGISASAARAVVAGTTSTRLLSIDCSGASPVITQRQVLGAHELSLPTFSNPTRAKRQALTFTNGNGLTAALPTWVTGAFNKRRDALAVTPTRESVYQQDVGAVGVSVSDVGANAMDSWLAADIAAAQAGANTLFLQRVEMATP